MVVAVAWNAGAVRARLLARRRLGPAAARDLAARPDLGEAVAGLLAGPYRHDLGPGGSLAAAQWAVAATPLWHLRVLAGWLPPAGGELVRALAGWWEVLNVENLLVGLGGGRPNPAYDLGRLETAWAHVRGAGSVADVRERLAASPWLDPGAGDVPAIVTWLRLSWASRVAEECDDAAGLATGWAALVLASDVLRGSRARAGARIPGGLLGSGWRAATTVPELYAGLPRSVRPLFEGVDGAEDLWRAEARWWRGLDDDGERLLRRATSGPKAVVGAFAVLLADAHRVQAALQVAARGGKDREVVHEAL